MAKNIPYASALAPEYAFLGFLAQQPAHGYELHQRLVSELGQVWHISLSQTYNILSRLQAKGLVAGHVEPQAKLPPRRRLQLTAAGRERFETWLRAPTGSSVRAIRVEFITRLYFAYALNPRMVGSLIEDQVQAVEVCLARLEEMLVALPQQHTFNRLGLELRVRQLGSILDWLAQCREVLSPAMSDPGGTMRSQASE